MYEMEGPQTSVLHHQLIAQPARVARAIADLRIPGSAAGCPVPEPAVLGQFPGFRSVRGFPRLRFPRPAMGNFYWGLQRRAIAKSRSF